MNSIYWYDYETFGTDPRRDRIAQFAGIRTDEELNIIDEPLTIYCKQSADFLPDPYACMVTGITPQKANAEGLPEAEFIASIHSEFSRAGTCVAGYNNIRFDDEFTRNALYRNFFNPYEHEWRNGNSRWDLIDIVRLTRALRPEGIHWPTGDDGRPSIRLELLTQANGISHESAHDATSDVYATIAVARLIRDAQPRLYDYMYGLRKKQAASQQINLRTRDAVLHVSSRYSTERNAIAMVIPICMHPSNKNSVIVYDLATDPDDYIAIDAEEISARLYTRTEDLPEGVERVPLKEIHLNKCPVIVPLKTMDTHSANRLGIDVDAQLQHRERILAEIEQLVTKTTDVFSGNRFSNPTDPDLMIYSGGFFNDEDQSRMTRVRKASREELATIDPVFDDQRLPEMLFRYRARNWPEHLGEEERILWQEFCQQRLTDPESSPRTWNQYQAEIESLQSSDTVTGPQLAMLQELLDYGQSIAAHQR